MFSNPIGYPDMNELHEARFYETLPDAPVLFTLCPHDCRIREGGRGACGVRYNKNGMLYPMVYDKVVSRRVESVDKKPLDYFYTGYTAYCPRTVWWHTL